MRDGDGSLKCGGNLVNRVYPIDGLHVRVAENLHSAVDVSEALPLCGHFTGISACRVEEDVWYQHKMMVGQTRYPE